MNLSQLASVLRENGDQVLNGTSKLSLSMKLLKELNDSFKVFIEERESMNSTFQVIGTSNSKVELLLDIQFLHDFIQRTVGLKLIEDNPEFCDRVSINKFKNLKFLELRKISLDKIIGLQPLRNQLQYITCIRCLQNLKDLFIFCGADKSQAYIWSELKEAVLSYNNLEAIDNSFDYVPWLRTLDLSHNFLVNAQAIDCLLHLNHLNLGFNYLETVPIFKKESFRNLQSLILNSNYIGDLTGLMYLNNLVTLDLSCNCLVDHDSLSPISNLAALQWLNLDGNPLSFHPQHRNITSKYLHLNTATIKFTLDRMLLSKSERKFIGTFLPRFQKKYVGIHQSSISSNMSDITNSSEITMIATSELVSSQSVERIKKVRVAVILENEENEDEREILDSSLVKSVNSISSINDHDDTREKIENLRTKYGENWLKYEGSSIMQDILGIEKSPKKLSSTPYEEDFMKHATEVLINNESKQTDISPDTSEKIEVTSDLSANNTFITASESSVFEDKEHVSNCSDVDELVEEEEEEYPYLAKVIREEAESEDIFIIIGEKYFKERDHLNGYVKSKWLLEVILSCEIISTNPTIFRIEFDTLRKNMKSREYILEDEGQKFHREISKILSQKPLSALNQTVYCCMKCLMQFSGYKDKSGNLPVCPNVNCNSTLIYEVDVESTPTNNSTLQNFDKSVDRPKSPSECSIASETENNPLAQIHVTAEVHMDNNASTSVPANCSAASVQESISSHLSTEENTSSENITRKYESDIEVISNPSLSSIEVLDDPTRPGRKRSSEERRAIMQPTLNTIPDVVLPVTVNATTLLHGMTESSSSSSFTESVCTAYDTQTHTSRPASDLEIQPAIIEEHKTNKTQMKDKEPKEEEKNKSTFTSLIEGLFSGPTTGTKSAKTTNDDIKFLFTEDFSTVDHRVKYYIYQNIFEDEHENFVWILRCVFFSSILGQPTQGCLLLSTYKVYILQIKEHDIRDDSTNWLIKKESYTIDRLQTLFTLPWKQGIGLEIRGAAKKNINYLCIIQDMQRTLNFLTFLASNPLPDSCDVVCASPERPMLNLQQLLLSHKTADVKPKDSTICLFSILSKCTVISTESNSVTFGIFVITASDLFILSELEWLLPDSEKSPKIFASQPISNLIELDLEDLTLNFHFLDEIASCTEVWNITWETDESLNTAISAVQEPWQEIFSVPLQINRKVHSM